MSAQNLKLIVGLGNIGKAYHFTRHNVGFMFIDYMAEQLNISSFSNKFDATYAKTEIEGITYILLKPSTYMNLSGISVLKTASFFKILPKDIWVVHDDIDLKFLQIKNKVAGGAGGHNGIISIDSHIGKEYNRLRIGIGRPEHKSEVSDYVLSKFTDSELLELQKAFVQIFQGFLSLIKTQ